VSYPAVRTGLDLLIEDRSELVRGRAVGLLCHAASVSRRLVHASDALEQLGARLVALFGPEHGVLGAAQDMEAVHSSEARADAVPVYSLYGDSEESLRPDAEWLRGLDLLVVDLQDVGARYYTYVWTAVLTLQVCAEVGVPVLLLDRPNPLGGVEIEGPGIDPDCHSFVGLHDVPVRHGMTYAELIALVCSELNVDLELQVLGLEGWRRELYFDQTGLPWVLPSPNMPTLETAVVYPGVCLVEATNASEGRGTTRPFEILGAPWVDGSSFAAELNALGLPGLKARPLSFAPTFQKHAGIHCGGVQLHVVDRVAFRPFVTGVAIIGCLRSVGEAFGWRDQPYEFVTEQPAIDLLAGGTWLRERLDPAELQDWRAWGGEWSAAQRQFAERRAPFLLYRD
jgi:uncharacterized protein YbbC (DUF1343 family)